MFFCISVINLSVVLVLYMVCVADAFIYVFIRCIACSVCMYLCCMAYVCIYLLIICIYILYCWCMWYCLFFTHVCMYFCSILVLLLSCADVVSILCRHLLAYVCACVHILWWNLYLLISLCAIVDVEVGVYYCYCWCVLYDGCC